jgi:phenylpropionate dioxygenase-like ring-hydroxylating dioxygenase large terminal subunit
MNFKDFWYVVCRKEDLNAKKPIARKILDELIVLYRDEAGKAVAMLDRCIHRNAPLSKGRMENGKLRCSYHGWLYDGSGEIVEIYSEGPGAPKGKCRKAKTFLTAEFDDYVFVCLSDTPLFPEPFRSPYYGKKGWRTQRRVNAMQNNVTNCVENFVDIPHTVFVHPTIFRNEKREKFGAEAVRKDGSVVVNITNERANLGLFSCFLNPKNQEIVHIDSYHMPNVTCVEYHFGPKKHFYITSHSVPVSDKETLVYTDLTYHYGFWTPFAGPFVRSLGQKVIDQDIEILGNQMKAIEKFGTNFQNSPCDIVHVFIESIRDAIAEGKDPRALPERSQKFEFWV